MDLKKVYEELKADFPAEAYSKDTSRGFALTSLKAQYAVERLNNVLGIDGWSMKGDFQESGKGFLYLGHLNLLDKGEIIHSVEAIGYSEIKKNMGDTYKSARTDALSKAASYLGLGNEMFKGNVSTEGVVSRPTPSKTVKTTVTKKEPEDTVASKTTFSRRQKKKVAEVEDDI